MEYSVPYVHAFGLIVWLTSIYMFIHKIRFCMKTNDLNDQYTTVSQALCFTLWN